MRLTIDNNVMYVRKTNRYKIETFFIQNLQIVYG